MQMQWLLGVVRATELQWPGDRSVHGIDTTLGSHGEYNGPRTAVLQWPHWNDPGIAVATGL